MKRITKIEAQRNEKKKLKVAAYARVSTGEEEQLISLEAQKNHYEKYIKARPNWEYAGLYYDEGISGTKIDKRDGLLRLLEDCDKGLVQYIVVKSISRFSRNTVDCVEIVRKLCEKGIFIFFEKENIDTGKMEGELLLSIMSSLAENESRSISDNLKWGVQKRFMAGTYKTASVPYGYHYENGEVIIDENMAGTVQWIFEEVLSGKAACSVARELNEKGIPSKTRRKWTGETVTVMIRNEKYMGDVLYQKTYTDDRYNRHYNNGEKPQYYLKDHYPAIVSKECFEKANAMLLINAKEKGNRPGKEHIRYVYSGKIICGECGNRCKRVIKKRYAGFSCKTHIHDKTACSMKMIPEEPVRGAFSTMMNKLIYGKDRILVPLLRSYKNNGRSLQVKKIEEIENRISSNMQRRQQILQFLSMGFLDDAVFTQEKENLLKEMEELQEEKKSLMVNDYKEQEAALMDLIKFTQTGSALHDFNDRLFENHVDHIIVFSQNEIGFVMKCGPVFRERIG